MSTLMPFSYTKCLLIATLLAVVISPSVHGLRCYSTIDKWSYETCGDYQYCCGFDNTVCCSNTSNQVMDAVVGLLFFLFIFVFCPVMCYRCCCRRTVSRGVVYSPAGTTNPVAVSLPPQHQQQQQSAPYPQQPPYPQQLPYPQPAPYPTVVPYPQQTPYPPQDPINPYYGGPPPPAYGQVTAQDSMQASAPYLHS